MIASSPAAGVLLAAAVLIAPPPPRHRLGILRPHSSVARRLPGALAALAVVLLCSPATALAAGLLVLTAAARRRRAGRRGRRREEARAMAAALETVVGELRIGAHPVRAFAAAGADGAAGVGAVMCAVAARARLGADVAAGLQAVGAATTVPAYWKRIAVCWRLAADHGLAMAALMQAAQRDIIGRQRFAERLDAALAGPRATAAILALLPAVGVLLGHLVGADPLRFLFGAGIGGWFLVAGAALIAAGLLWADAILETRTA